MASISKLGFLENFGGPQKIQKKKKSASSKKFFVPSGVSTRPKELPVCRSPPPRPSFWSPNYPYSSAAVGGGTLAPDGVKAALFIAKKWILAPYTPNTPQYRSDHSVMLLKHIYVANYGLL